MSKSEAAIQQEMVVYYRNKYCLKHHKPRHLIFSVPNENTAGYLVMRTLLLTGLLSGVSDLIVVKPNKVIFIEVKTATGSQSANQKKFQTTVEGLGFRYHVVRSLEQFKTAVE